MKGRYIEGITDMKVDIQTDITDTKARYIKRYY